MRNSTQVQPLPSWNGVLSRRCPVPATHVAGMCGGGPKPPRATGIANETGLLPARWRLTGSDPQRDRSGRRWREASSTDGPASLVARSLDGSTPTSWEQCAVPRPRGRGISRRRLGRSFNPAPGKGGRRGGWAPVSHETGVRNGGTTPPCAMGDGRQSANHFARTRLDRRQEQCGHAATFGAHTAAHSSRETNRNEGARGG